tara:strand:+ start:8470 stop:9486 length:1017 start_codon:yes stop_codon:yes gene_type:complete
MALNFNNDIAPLRSQFFPVGGMRQSEFRQLHANYMQSIAPVQEQSIKMANDMLNMHQQDLAYQRSQEALAATRRKAKGEIEAMEQMPALMENLDAILNDDSKDAYQQTSDIARLQMSMAGALPYSPAMQNMFTSAAQTAQANAARANKEEQDLRRKEQREAGIHHTLAQMGAVEEVDRSTAVDGEISDLDKSYRGLARHMQGTSEAKAAKEKAQLERSIINTRTDNQRKRLLQHEATLLKMGVVDDDFVAQSLKDGVVQEPQTTGKLEFSPEEREQLEEIILSLNPNLDPEFVASSSTKDVYRAALRTINQSVTRLNEGTGVAGKTPTGAPTIASHFD